MTQVYYLMLAIIILFIIVVIGYFAFKAGDDEPSELHSRDRMNVADQIMEQVRKDEEGNGLF